jgi:hypothetical protein
VLITRACDGPLVAPWSTGHEHADGIGSTLFDRDVRLVGVIFAVSGH